MKILDVNSVGKQYGKTYVVDDISFSINTGEIVGLIGANGAGKSTLLKMISHLVIPSSGKIWFNNYNMETQYEKALKKMGVNLCEGMLINSLSAYQNICMRVDALGWCSKERKKIVQNVMDAFEMIEYANKKCEDYSLGMKQRTALAMACVGNPDLLILDEPMNGLDPAGIKHTHERIKKMAQDGVAAIISSHLLYDIEKICDRILVMEKGKLLADMRVEDIIRQYGNVEDFYFEKTEG